MKIKERIKKYFTRKPHRIFFDALFWALIILMLIPSTRAGFIGAVSKVRTVVLQRDIQSDNGPDFEDDARAWSLVDLDGNHVKLGDFEGKVMLINLWATWCPPCRAEMPSLEKLYADYGSKVEFLLVSNENPEPIREYIEKKKYTFPVYLTLSAPPASMETKSIPTTFILNKDGQQVFNKSGAFDWNSKKVRDYLDALLLE